MIRIYKSTIPYFIPTDIISNKLLNTNINLFIDIMSDYLNAYVSRRNQVQEVKNNYEDIVATTTEGFDSVTIKYGAIGRRFLFHLLYTDLSRSLPTKVVIYVFENKGPKKRWKANEELFLTKELHVAFAECLTLDEMRKRALKIYNITPSKFSAHE